MSFPLTGAELKSRLRAVGFKPRKALGQNFLLDGNLARAIVRDSGVTSGDLVLEVGPGPGLLTAELLDAGARIIAAEIDDVLADLCEELLGCDGLDIVRGDVLGGGGIAPAVAEALDGREFTVVSNLPYSAGTPFLCELAVSDLRWRGATVMLDGELSGRLAAAPGSRDSSAAGAVIHSVASVEKLRPVPSEVFWPRPRTRSALLRVTPEPDRPGVRLGAAGRRGLSEFLSSLYAGRRKMARNAVLRAAPEVDADAILARIGIDPEARPERLTIDELVALYEAVRGISQGGG